MLADMGFTSAQARKALRETVRLGALVYHSLSDATDSAGRQC